MANLLTTSDDLWACINAILDDQFDSNKLSYAESVALRKLYDGAKELNEMNDKIEKLLYNQYK